MPKGYRKNGKTIGDDNRGKVAWNKGKQLSVETCLKMTEHGMSSTRLYHIWASMKSRCLDKNAASYEDYGGCGITVCPKWLSFNGFYDDMSASYKKGLTIDRIDNDKGYYKENCRWATYTQQARNTRKFIKAKRYFLNGLPRTIGELSEITGIKRTTLAMRLGKYEWDLERAIYVK